MPFSYDDAHEYLNTLLVFGIKLGLKNMETLCTLLGNPQNSMKFVHVAGTNGKGSSCSMLAAGLKNAGVNTGFYSSPFLCNFTERWRVNGFEVSESQVAKAISQIASMEDELIRETGVKPTYFEVVTAAAILIFKDAGVEVVVWETGMGGRLDATNVVDPLVCLITNIGLDHTQYLGETIEEVAGEKAGIIKSHKPVILGELCDSAFEVFKTKAEVSQSPTYRETIDFSIVASELKEIDGVPKRQLKYKSLENQCDVNLSMLGTYQVKNAGLVLKAFEILSEKLSIDFSSLKKGMEKAVWPGRFEVRGNLVLDGAHNEPAARVLIESLNELYPGRKINFVCGILDDKNWQALIDCLLPLAKSFFMVEVQNVRTSKPESLRQYVEEKDGLVSGVGNAKKALEEIAENEVTVVVGSLYLIGEVLSILNNHKALPVEVD